VASVKEKKIRITHLLRPHWAALAGAFVAVIGETVTESAGALAAEDCFRLRAVVKAHAGLAGQHNNIVFGKDRLAILSSRRWQCWQSPWLEHSARTRKSISPPVSASGSCMTCGGRFTTTYNGCRLLITTRKGTGDLISRVTSDIDAIQSLISTTLLGLVVNVLTLVGMIAVMFYLSWRFTLIALLVAPALFVVVYSFYAPHQTG